MATGEPHLENFGVLKEKVEKHDKDLQQIALDLADLEKRIAALKEAISVESK